MAVIRGAEGWSPEGLDERERENQEAQRRREIWLMAENDCFLCHKTLGYPAIYWGGTVDLLLHPGCVRKLTAGLMRDVHEVEGGPS